MNARVLAVAAHPAHAFSKPQTNSIELVAGLGVAGDAHCGATVKHRSRVAIDPTQPNLRQVHLLHAEVFGDLAARGFQLTPGAIGENITTQGIDLLALSRGALLKIGATAVVEITGLRNPCGQLDAFAPGLMSALLDRGTDGGLVRKAGVMGIVICGGRVAPGDAIVIEAPAGPHIRLERV